MRRPGIDRLRALGLLAVVLAFAATALWSVAWQSDVTVFHHSSTPVFADPDQAIVTPAAAEAKITSRWLMPLAALGAAVAIAIAYFARRDLRLVRVSFTVRQRLVRARRRAPPIGLALHTF
jgi:hypothetical protein